jgi:hypothetical protein
MSLFACGFGWHGGGMGSVWAVDSFAGGVGVTRLPAPVTANIAETATAENNFGAELVFRSVNMGFDSYREEAGGAACSSMAAIEGEQPMIPTPAWPRRESASTPERLM